ncbi:putative integral membrane protein [Leucobacter sp. 7(1)]|uniref:hypothetical protein n=1 Tax=Leucobacter sp. 7(1) TaxID=1255613 RepID=UPI00097EB022|nr:hypothetical protein [Leucobacter sp. 7(1)]SJN10867.1 putative integral membrane protein [Leucobacter sp. 7(1)]
MTTASRLPHLVRGACAATIATYAALFSHVLAGGAMPAPLGIVAPLLLSLLVCVLLAGRKLSLTRLSISVMASQTLFHTLFVLGAVPSNGAGVPTGGPHQNHGQMAIALPAISGETVELIQGSTVMWASHAIGAVVTILFLYRGERTIHRLRVLAERIGLWLGRRLQAPLRAVPVRPPVRVQPRPARGWTVLAQLRASVLIRRGPPVLSGLSR